MIDDDLIIKKLRDPKTVNEGFSMLVGEYSEKLYWQVRRIVITHDDANDVVQEAFLKAWRYRDSFEGKSKIYTWLSRIAVNEALNHLHQKQRIADVTTDDADGLANRLMADEYFDGDRTAALLQEAVARLPEVQRLVFNMKYYDEMKYSEISKVLGTTEGALKASYHLAVKKIAEYIKKFE